MGFRDVVDQFQDQNGFTNTGTTEQSNFTTTCIWCEKINNFNTGNQNF